MNKPSPTQGMHASLTLHPCPNCRTIISWLDNPYKPFCSKRCKLIDLGAWASEQYKLPANETPFSSDLN